MPALLALEPTGLKPTVTAHRLFWYLQRRSSQAVRQLASPSLRPHPRGSRRPLLQLPPLLPRRLQRIR